jgi:hypothetical protein
MVIVLAVLLAATNRSIVHKDSAVVEVFAATTPCGDIIKPLHQISQQSNCDLVEWNLTLFEDPATHQPATYKIVAVNRFMEKPSNMYSQPGTKTERIGKWSIIRGSKKNPQAVIYQLNTDDAKTSLRFLKLSDNLLHLLDKNDELMIGNLFGSYTLNKIKK